MPAFVLKHNVERREELSTYATRARLGSTFCLDLASCQFGGTSHHIFIPVLSSGSGWFVYFDCKLCRAGSSAGLQQEQLGYALGDYNCCFMNTSTMQIKIVTLVSIKITYSEKPKSQQHHLISSCCLPSH